MSITINRGVETAKKQVHELHNESEANSRLNLPARNKKTEAEGLPTLKCVCGEEILVVPDLEEMDKAIKDHIAKHKRTENDEEESGRLGYLEQYLVEQLLKIAADKSTQ